MRARTAAILARAIVNLGFAFSAGWAWHEGWHAVVIGVFMLIVCNIESMLWDRR